MSGDGEWRQELDKKQLDDVRGLLLAVREADGRPEVGPEGPLPGEFDGGEHLVACVEGDVVGYAHIDTTGDSFGHQVAELFVHPAHRNRGYGAKLLHALDERAAVGFRVWAHGDHPAAQRLARKTGLERKRELLILRVEVDGADWPEPILRDGVSLRTFVPEQDEDAVVQVNARAFDWHPEQGALTADDVRADEARPWFDAEGFFLAVEEDTAAGSGNDTVIGFHWTKVHEPTPGRFDGERVGEVYVVGVDPAAQGGGLGRALTLAGLRYLAGRGLRQIILYVEGDNAAALAVYTKLGFARYETDVQYGR
ncbi:mycothiol synthase [Amycolatopsis balhimycina DSM 5908]|uniref:Mycothiol acetyltransferase n=1 Tax=Amycolatopsis balhimycina DSM 5908 TaxID=1081091 RepID=A0A428WJU0_AMYBA|nr:mycothiol synthase [Amycolatopsis balhimycina]RSM43349.1 mycothiol synthase [Amycolatopsis balhimycina DSM 5908]